MAERFPALDSALKEPANELRRWESTGESTSRSESCQRQPPHRCKGGADPSRAPPLVFLRQRRLEAAIGDDP